MAGGGRFIAGLGVSGPQIVEGWYGQPWGKPYWRMRDYVAIMRKIFAREAPVTHDGARDRAALHRARRHGHRQAAEIDPAHEPATSRSISRPATRRRSKLTAEIADGWLPMGFMPGAMAEYRPWLEEGFRRAGNGKGFKDFAIHASVHVEVDNDVAGRARQAEARGRRSMSAAWAITDKNFHNDIMVRRGFGDAGQAHPGTLPGGPQGRGHRRRARRMGRHEVAGRPAGAASARAATRLGGSGAGLAELSASRASRRPASVMAHGAPGRLNWGADPISRRIIQGVGSRQA